MRPPRRGGTRVISGSPPSSSTASGRGLPLYVGLVRDDARVHLSEHTGDARPHTLIYLWVPDVDAAAAACGVTAIHDNEWGRDFEVRDPDGNRIRVGTPPSVA